MNKKNFLDKSGVSYLWQRIKNLLFERELEYPKPVDNKLIYSENNQFVNDYLMRNDDILVVDNDVDFLNCRTNSDFETDILGAWKQFTNYKEYSPEYGDGKYIPLHSNYIGSSSMFTPGYGYWYSETSGEIRNNVNSYDFNGYMMPFAKSNYSVESIFGTLKGNTTGDNIGFSIVNDKNAIAKHIKTNTGRVYYRNTLYDLFSDTTVPKRPVKSAWVCEDVPNDCAYVIYTDSPTSSGVEANPKIDSEHFVYYLDGIKNNGGRRRYSVSDLTEENALHDKEIVNEYTTASGTIDLVTITVTNSSGLDLGIGASGTNKGTIYVYGLRYDIPSGTFTTQEVFKGEDKKLGRLLVKYNENLDTNSLHPCVIKSLVNFENGILTVEFSDAKSTQDEITEYNGSELKIDFNKRVYSITPRTSYPVDDNDCLESGLTIPKDVILPTNSLEDNFWNQFTSDTKFMYHAYSYTNLYIKCLNIAIDTTILNVDKTSGDYGVWKLNDERNFYVKIIDPQTNELINPCEYLAGSKMSYNRLTKKLFYSDGENIYQVAEGIIDRDSLKGDPGEPGATGIGLEYEWDGTQLGVKREDEDAFNYTDLIGPGLEFEWDGTYLGVRKEGDSYFEYTDLIGPQGPYGESGIGIGYLGCTWDQYEIILQQMYFDESGTLKFLETTDEIPDNSVRLLDKFPCLSAEYFSPWLDNTYNWLNHTSSTCVFEKYINYLEEIKPDIYSELYNYFEEIAYAYISLFVQQMIENAGILALILPITPWGDYPALSTKGSLSIVFGGNIHSYRGGNSILFYEDEITTDTNNKADVPTSFSVRVGDLVIDENFNLYKCIEE